MEISGKLLRDSIISGANNIANAVKKYGVFCLAILCLTIFTHLPLWGAITTALGMAVFPAVYIFRLYYPLEG